MSKELTNSAAPPAPRAPPAPPPRPAAAPAKSRRKFLTLIAVVGGILSLTPYVPFGQFLSSSASGTAALTKPQTVVLDIRSENGNAGGKKVNVNDLATFPPNTRWLITYPSSGDPTRDGQNPDSFVKWELIRLPTELGGTNKSASDFVAFSKVCVHLWCSPNYGAGLPNPPPEHRVYECPCHGSLYSVGANKQPVGVAVFGPAQVQPPPTNAIPLLTLTTDSAGNLQVVPPIWDVEHNGVLGYGRNTGSGAFTREYQPQ